MNFLFILFLLCPFLLQAEVKMTVVICSYNNEQYAEENIKSLATQDYPHWDMIYINDHSNDKTGRVVEQLVKKYGIEDKSYIIHNEARKGATENIYTAAHLVDPKRVIVLLDGDDMLKGKKVLSKIAKIYKNKKVWLTYGNYETYPKNAPGWNPDSCYKFPKEVIQNRRFRQFTWICYPLRTFYAKLFHNIKEQDLKYKGKFFPVVSDTGMMFPMLEMASDGHIRYVNKSLYIYRINTGINDFFVRKPLMEEVSAHIRSQPPYAPLKKLF